MTQKATDLPSRRTESHLFTVRLWPGPDPEAGSGWRGRVTHVLSGETRYFREWPALADFLNTVLVDAEADRPYREVPDPTRASGDSHVARPKQTGQDPITKVD